MAPSSLVELLAARQRRRHRQYRLVGRAGWHSGSNGYGASRAAIAHLTGNLACAWAAKGIRVSCVAPGYIEAPMSAEMFADSRVEPRPDRAAIANAAAWRRG
ncbi:SDR family oxidoreductase [Bradyrhizobium sp. BRP56]|nr:SDR family oxidoreductase [Bradyrhizobium sp. BRP56]